MEKCFFIGILFMEFKSGHTQRTVDNCHTTLIRHQQVIKEFFDNHKKKINNWNQYLLKVQRKH